MSFSRPVQPLSMSATDWLLLLLLSVLWGGSFYFAKIAVQEIPPLTLALGRVGIAAGMLVIVARAMALPFPRNAAIWGQLAVMATLNNVLPLVLIFWGQIHLSVGLASIFNATGPLFGVLAAHFMTHDDRLSAGRIVGLLFGFAGVIVLLGPDLLAELGTHVLAELACLAAACCYGVGAAFTRRVRDMSPVMVATAQLTISAIILLPAVVLFDRPSALLSASHAAIGALLALALLSSALGYMIYVRLIARAGATNALITTFLIPISAILLGVMLLNETVTARQLAGMAAIFVGIAAIDGRLARAIARTFRC